MKNDRQNTRGELVGSGPAFFVPGTTSENQESTYATYAKLCYCDPPKPGERICSITFTHDGAVWTATVGEILRGAKTTTHRSKSKKYDRRIDLSDPAVVLAIFPGTPYMVVTNHWRNAPVGSGWVNPFMAGQPSLIGYFGES